MNLRDFARRTASLMVPRGVVNRSLRWTRYVLGPARYDALMGRGHRKAGYELLTGHGIEIGALHAPAPVPPGCVVTYVDAITTDDAKRFFPEIDASRLVQVDIVADMDRDGLSAIDDAAYDFVVMNHVIEHVANPMWVIEELFRVVRPGGVVVLSAPDMRFTFDRVRKLTPLPHLLEEYRTGVRSVTRQHYEEFVSAVMPDLSRGPGFNNEVDRAASRREHAHVWDSREFDLFLSAVFEATSTKASLLFRSTGDENRLEDFSVWRRDG